MQWFRLWCEISRDPKVRTMPRDCQLDFIYLLCMKGDESLPNSDKNIAFYLQISEKKWKKNKIFILNNNLIFEKDGMVDISSWEKRQYKSDTSTDRVKKHRGKVKRFSNVSETLDETHQSRTEQNNKETTTTQDLTKNPVEVPNSEPKKRSGGFFVNSKKQKSKAEKENNNFLFGRWTGVSCEPLKDIGFTQKDIQRIAAKHPGFANDCERSIEAFAEDLKHPELTEYIETTAYNLFMGVMLKGNEYKPKFDKSKSPEAKAKQQAEMELKLKRDDDVSLQRANERLGL